MKLLPLKIIVIDKNKTERSAIIDIEDRSELGYGVYLSIFSNINEFKGHLSLKKIKDGFGWAYGLINLDTQYRRTNCLNKNIMFEIIGRIMSNRGFSWKTQGLSKSFEEIVL